MSQQTRTDNKKEKKRRKGLKRKGKRSKVVNFVPVGILFFQLKWNVSVLEYFSVPFRGYTVYIYIYSTNIIQIQDKLIINYAIQIQCYINLKFKIFLNSQD